MADHSKNITLPKALIKKKEGVVIMSLEEYEKLKEDMDMLRSKNFAKGLQKARKEKETVSLEDLLKENNLS